MEDIQRAISATEARIQTLESRIQSGQSAYDAYLLNLNELRPRAARLHADLKDSNMRHWWNDIRTELGHVSYVIGRYEADIASYEKRLKAMEGEYGGCFERLARLNQQLAEAKASGERKSEDEEPNRKVSARLVALSLTLSATLTRPANPLPMIDHRDIITIYAASKESTKLGRHHDLDSHPTQTCP